MSAKNHDSVASFYERMERHKQARERARASASFNLYVQTIEKPKLTDSKRYFYAGETEKSLMRAIEKTHSLKRWIR